MRARRSGVSASGGVFTNCRQAIVSEHTPRSCAALLVVLGALVAVGCGENPTTAGETASTTATTRPQRPVLCGKLRASIVGRVETAAATELSGLVLSRSQRGVLWTHNDSGDEPRLLAVGLDGRLLADVSLTGAEAFDWEDVAAGPRELYVGDIGDNVPQRDAIVVYRVPEPRVLGGGASPTAAQATRIELRYPDGRRDAEALLRDPVSGALVVVSKSAGGRAGIYVAEKPGAGAATTMRRRGSIELGEGEAVTAGDVSADGRTIVLRTYTSAYVWTRRPGERVASALRRKPCTAGAALFEGQGEALAVAADGRAFYTVPEGPAPAIRRYAPV